MKRPRSSVGGCVSRALPLQEHLCSRPLRPAGRDSDRLSRTLHTVCFRLSCCLTSIRQQAGSHPSPLPTLPNGTGRLGTGTVRLSGFRLGILQLQRPRRNASHSIASAHLYAAASRSGHRHSLRFFVTRASGSSLLTSAIHFRPSLLTCPLSRTGPTSVAPSALSRVQNLRTPHPSSLRCDEGGGSQLTTLAPRQARTKARHESAHTAD